MSELTDDALKEVDINYRIWQRKGYRIVFRGHVRFGVRGRIGQILGNIAGRLLLPYGGEVVLSGSPIYYADGIEHVTMSRVLFDEYCSKQMKCAKVQP